MKNPKIKMMPDCVDGQHVWIVYCGMQVVAYAWPKNGKTSYEIAQEIIANAQK